MFESQVKWLTGSLVRAVFGARVITLRGPAGVPFRFRPADYVRFLGGVARGCAPQRRLWEPLLRPGEVIYDVGANIGATVQLFFGMLNGQCRVYAFEPISGNFEFLRSNTQALGPQLVTLVHSAVGDQDGEAVFVENPDHPGLSRLAERVPKSARSSLYWSRQIQVSVPMLRLDTFLSEHPDARPTFLKIDVEGAAGRVLRGATALLAQCRPAITCEFHWADEKEDVTRTLEAAGYRALVTSADGNCSARAPTALPNRHEGNFVHVSDARLVELTATRPGIHSAGRRW